MMTAFSSVDQLYPTLCDSMNHSTPGLPVHHQLPEFTKPMSIESVMPSNHLFLCHSLLLLPSIFPSIGVFSNELALCIRWPKYWSFIFSISASKEYSGLISFRMHWLDIPAVQGLSLSMYLNTIYVPLTPKFLSPTLTFSQMPDLLFNCPPDISACLFNGHINSCIARPTPPTVFHI